MGLLRVRTVLSGWIGGPGLSTCYFATADGLVDAADAATVAGRVRGAWDVWKTVLPVGVTAQVQPVVDDLSAASGDLIGSFGITAPAVVNGADTAGPGAAQVAIGLDLFTSAIVNGKRIKGRLFLSPLIGTRINTQQPAASIKTAADAMGVALITATPLAADPFAVVWHRPSVASPLGGSAHRIVAATMNPDFFTLRSRSAKS